jgi:hypothetical protein
VIEWGARHDEKRILTKNEETASEVYLITLKQGDRPPTNGEAVSSSGYHFS